jgi:Molybdopterin-guanine dinucleotide biosynthesis protein A
MMKRAGIILAGGNSSRIGVDKSLIEMNGERMVERVIDRVGRCVDEIIVVVGKEDKKIELGKILDVKILIDSIKGFGPLAGIYEGLRYARAEYCGIFACDLPFLNVDVVDFYSIRVKGLMPPFLCGRTDIGNHCILCTEGFPCWMPARSR